MRCCSLRRQFTTYEEKLEGYGVTGEGGKVSMRRGRNEGRAEKREHGGKEEKGV